MAGQPKEGEAQRGFWDGRKMWVGGKEILAGVSSETKATLLHAARGSAYVLLGLFSVPLFVSSYAATVSAVGELRDKRLEEANRGVREAVMREQRVRREKAGEVGRERGRERGRGTGRKVEAGAGDMDDASPTGGGGVMMDVGSEGEEERLGGAGDMGGLMSDGQMRTAEARARPRPDQSPTSSRGATYQLDKVESQPKDFAADFEPARPASESAEAGEGSVWERIRQQSAAEPSGSNIGRGRRAWGSGERGRQEEDAFSFSSEEEEGSFARSEKQREFDERVERERRGGEFGDGGRRW